MLASSGRQSAGRQRTPDRPGTLDRSPAFGPEAGTEPITARTEAAATLVALLVGEPVEEHEDGGDRVGDSFARVSER
jgi:hypothetical protein